MTVAELIRTLEKLPPETVVVKFHRLGEEGADGYDEVWLVEGTHNGNGHLRVNRAKFVKGQPKPDYLSLENHPSRTARRVPFVVIV